jgi:hypothetical protein
MEKNKTGKYLKYAIGEIFLVVIGILIAFGLNNKVSDLQIKSREKLHLQNLFQELQQIEIQSKNEKILLKRRVTNNCKYLLEVIHFQNNKIIIDSLNKATFWMITLPNTEIGFKTYDNIVNTDDLRIIQSNTIKYALADVAQAIVFQSEVLSWQSEQWININQPYINNHVEFLDITPKEITEDLNTPSSSFKTDWNFILKDMEFRNIVYNRLLAAIDVTHSYDMLLKKVENCKVQIKKELKELYN